MGRTERSTKNLVSVTFIKDHDAGIPKGKETAVSLEIANKWEEEGYVKVDSDSRKAVVANRSEARNKADGILAASKKAKAKKRAADKKETERIQKENVKRREEIGARTTGQISSSNNMIAEIKLKQREEKAALLEEAEKEAEEAEGKRKPDADETEEEKDERVAKEAKDAEDAKATKEAEAKDKKEEEEVEAEIKHEEEAAAGREGDDAKEDAEAPESGSEAPKEEKKGVIKSLLDKMTGDKDKDKEEGK